MRAATRDGGGGTGGQVVVGGALTGFRAVRGKGWRGMKTYLLATAAALVLGGPAAASTLTEAGREPWVKNTQSADTAAKSDDYGSLMSQLNDKGYVVNTPVARPDYNLPPVVDFTFAIQCDAWDTQIGVEGKVKISDGNVPVSYNNGKPDQVNLTWLLGTIVTEVTDNAIIIGGHPGTHGFFDRRTGEGEVSEGYVNRTTDKPEAYVEHTEVVMTFKNCQPSRSQRQATDGR
jgi:hypothetical protein